MQLIVWILIIVVILLILALPVGIDAAYDGEDRFLKLKIGPFRKTLLPKEKKKRPERDKKTKPKPKPEAADETAEKKKKRFSLDDCLTLAEIGLDALHRIRMHLSVDRFVLSWTAAAADPYDAVMQYGRVNAVIGALMAKAHNALRIRDEDVRTEIDLTAARPDIRTRLVLSIQIWEILLVVAVAGAAGLRWIIKRKHSERAAAGDAAERSIEHG